MSKRARIVLFAFVAAVAFAAAPAHAQMATDNRLDEIVQLYRVQSGQWTAVLTGYAIRLFWLLAGIEFTFAAITLALKGADLSEWVASLVNQILFIGFFYTLLTHSAEWSQAIVNSFRTAANAASTSAGGADGISPSDVFEVGLTLAAQVLDATSFWAPGDSLSLMISALVIVVCFGLIAAFLILALVEMYLVTSAGVLFMGFGGSRFTKQFAVSMLTYAVSVGAKLFVLTLLIGLGEALISGFVAQMGTTAADIFVMVGVAVVFLAVTKMIPDLVQGLINGWSTSSGAALLASGASVAASAAAGAAGGAALGSMTHGAFALAREQMAAAGHSPAGGLGRHAVMTGLAMKNIGTSALADLGSRLGGRPGAHHGLMPGRMGGAMRDSAALLKSSNEKPQPPRAGAEPPSKV